MSNKKIPNTEITQMAQHPDYAAEVAAIVRSNLAPKLMGEQVLDHHENDIAAALELLNRDERAKLYRVIDPDSLASIIEYAEDPNERISELRVRQRVEILSRLEPAVAAEYLRQQSKADRTALIDLMDDEIKREIILISSFDEDEIGSSMTTNYVSIPHGLSVRQAMRELVDQAAENDNISTIYVTDEDGSFVGAIDLKDLIIARETTPLDEIIMTSYPYVYASELIEECIERIKDYSEDSIPVLDADNKLCGVLTAQDITQMVDDEMGDDYAKLAGLTAEEDLMEPLKKSISKRLPWLIVLLGLGLVVSSVVGVFESVVATLPLVVCFQSLILDMAGNVGTQSLAITIRVLMDEQLTGRQKFALIAKESRVGLCNGLILGVLSFLCIGLFLFIKGETMTMAFSVSFCTGIALVLSMFLSSISGTVIPLIFKKMKVDPAVASGPLITTVNDLVAVMTYYGLAWLLLIEMMHL